MQKVITLTEVVHFGQIKTHTTALLACQGLGKEVNAVRTNYMQPLTCKRCWAQMVHNPRTALIALGISLAKYDAQLQETRNIDERIELMNKLGLKEDTIG